jgi:putative DNA methylase
MTHPVKAPRKLIEVALPLEAINEESARRKRKAPKGYPTMIHKWWAQRPVAAARAVIFAQMVNDPSWKWELEHPGETSPSHLKATWAKSRRRLFGIIEELVKWENTTNEPVLEKARAEIRRSWRETCEANAEHPLARELFDPDRIPPLHDPFAGGGTIPLEAQRLGLQVYASDLNPIAVLINKAMIEIPQQYSSLQPVNPESRAETLLISREWKGLQGLSEDVRYYGDWVRRAAEQRIGHLYPPIDVTPAVVKGRPDLNGYLGQRLTPVAWLWARTVPSPSPAFAGTQVPLVSSFYLSTKPGKEVFVAPEIEGSTYRFEVRTGRPENWGALSKGTKLSQGSFRCLLSGAPIPYDYVDKQARDGKLGVRLLATVAEGSRGRVYLSPTPDAEALAETARPSWQPETASRGTWASNAQGRRYGFNVFADYFSPRQLTTLSTFSDLLPEVAELVRQDATAAFTAEVQHRSPIEDERARSYASAVQTYLALALGRLIDYGSSLATWRPKDNAMRSSLSMQAIPMTWDFAEGSPFGASSSDFRECVRAVTDVMNVALTRGRGVATQQSAQTARFADGRQPVVSTDPPYFNNISYADLSDFFVVWFRRALRDVHHDLFATITSPKADELIAAPHRHGGAAQAEMFFVSGMTAAMSNIAVSAHSAFPVTIYYAIKQAETDTDDGTTSSGWETFLNAVLGAGFSVTGTWPVRTEGDNRQVGVGSNALASSIVLVCRRRPSTAPTVSRRQFVAELRAVLPEALDAMIRGAEEWGVAVAPVDLSQAMIGPGMEIFSKYTAVLEADGTPMSVRTALALINRFLADDDFDVDTQFCVAWFEQYGWNVGPFGTADVLARAKGTSVDGVKGAGVLHSTGGSVRLTKWSEYSANWDPATDSRVPVWEVLHHLVRAHRIGGEQEAGRLLMLVQSRAERARQLAYRLYTLCERASRAEDARAYNELITGWSAIESAGSATTVAEQPTLFDA